jgi:transposase
MDEHPDSIAPDESAHTTSRRRGRSAPLEIITRGERRRRWTTEQKREIVVESYGPDLTPTEVARKHGISSGQLYTWRNEVLGLRTAVLTRAAPQFAEVELPAAPSPALPSAAASGPPQPQAPPCPGGRIEILLPGDIVVRVDAEVDGAALRRVLDALRRR